MGRGSSKAGAGGGDGGNMTAMQTTQNTGAITRQEEEALARRAEKNAASDLNDAYTAAMSVAYDGYNTQGDPLSDEQMAINSIVGIGALNQPTSLSFNSWVDGELAYRGLGGKNPKQVAQKAANEFKALANEVYTPGEKQFYQDMQTFSNMVAKYY